MEQSIDELDAWYEEERDTRQRALHEWRAKVRMREENLAEITRQAAEDYSPEVVADPRVGLLEDAFHSLGQEVGPALEQLREAAAEGSDFQQRVNVVLAAAANLYGSIGSAVASEGRQEQAQRRPAQPQQQQQWQQWSRWHEGRSGWQGDDGSRGYGTGAVQYHIGDGWGGDDWDWWGGRGHSWCDWEPGQAAGTWESEAGAGDTEAGMDTSGVQVPKWMRRESAGDCDHGGRLWKKGRMVDAEGEAHRGAAAGEDAADGALAGGAADGREAEAEALQARREEILKQATTDGVAVDPSAIAAMGREQLETWAKDNLL